jgi:hypothetical protein
MLAEPITRTWHVYDALTTRLTDQIRAAAIRLGESLPIPVAGRPLHQEYDL